MKSFEGQPRYQGQTILNEAPPGQKIRVVFRDNETLDGSTLNLSQDSLGSFVFPADGGSNNIKAYVVNAAIKEVQTTKAA